MILAWIAASAVADDLELILHDPTAQAAPADACVHRVCTSLLEVIDGARSTLDLAFYGFRHQTALLHAVERARARGVRVRVIVDRDVHGDNYYASTGRWTRAFGARDDLAVDQRTAASQRSFPFRPRCPRPDGFAGPLQCTAFDLGDRCYLAAHASREPIVFAGHIMHDKFAVADARHLWTGSANASDSGTGGYNANVVLRVDSPTVARWYVDEFEQMYIHGRFHREKEAGGSRRVWIVPDRVHVTSLFSPQDRPVHEALRPLLQGARSRIDVAVFFLTHKRLAQDLIDAHRRGVRVRVILDATAARNGYTKHEVLRAAGIPVEVESWGGKMHAKSAMIDGEVVIAGSMNWTAAGERDNDENTLVVRSTEHARQYAAWFDRLWADLGGTWRTGRPDPESRASRTACSDGVDNDFDSLADAADPGCGGSPPPLRPLPPGRIVPKPPGGTCSWTEAP